MATAKITTLIDRPDTFELVRDQIAAILVLESQAQEALAVTAGKDPALWRLKVYLERANPWADFIEAPAEATPIVNVSYSSSSFDQSRSNVVERQQGVGTFLIDCYGYGIASDEASGHQPGDEESALVCHRAVRIVRNILMAGPYTYLGMQGVVGFRFPDSISIQRPPTDSSFVQNIVGGRLSLQVRYNEFSPQAQGELSELVAMTVMRAGDGLVLLRAQYP